MVATTTPVTLEERIRVAGASLSRELLEDVRAKGLEGVALLEQVLATDGRAYYAGLLKLAIAWVRGNFDEVQTAHADEWAGEILRALKRNPAALFRPRRIVAFNVLEHEVQGTLDSRDQHRAFEAARERLIAGAGADDEDFAPFEREDPKVGRNDPCPCGSGKKFKKCCESKAEAPRRRIGDLLREARYTYEFYALDFEEQLRLLDLDACRAHFEILATPKRVRSYPAGDQYLTLAALSREADPFESGPRWTRDAALALLEGPEHIAVDRAEIGSWLLATREDESQALAPRIVAALERGAPLRLASVVNVVTVLMDVDPALADRFLKASTIPRDPRMSILRAITARELEDDLRVLEELESARDAIAADASSRELYVALLEALASLDDPPVREDDLLASFSADVVDPSVGVAPAPEKIAPATSLAAREATARRGRTSPYVVQALDGRVGDALEAATTRVRDLHAEAVPARAEEDASQAEVEALEKALASARSRATRARRAHAQADAAARDAEKGVGAAALEPVLAALQLGERSLREASGDSRGTDVTVAIPLAASGGRTVVMLPVPAEAARGEGDQALVEVALASVAAVAESVAPGSRVRPGDAYGRLALLVDAGLDAEIFAVALEGAWTKLDRVARARLEPQVCPITGRAAQEVVARTSDLDLPALSAATSTLAFEEAPLVVAAEILGVSLFSLALQLGARGLWTGARVPSSSTDLLREGSARPRPRSTESTPRPERDEGDRLADDLDQDPHPARRTLRVILRRLLRFGKIGASHTRIDNTLRGAAPHLRGLMKEVMLVLLRLGVLRRKPTLNGLHVSIEPERVPEVDSLIRTGEIPWASIQEMLGV